MEIKNKKILVSAIIVVAIAFISFNFETITGQQIREPIPFPKISLSTIGHDNPQFEPVVNGRSKLYINLEEVYPSQEFEFYLQDTPTDRKVGQFTVRTSSDCETTGKGRYTCKTDELLPKDASRWPTGTYYLQAESKINDPNDNYRRGDLIGKKAFFKYIE
tara:strand:- start:1177 stop:1659 length:483 start_codon:yes stop_codon:yes gene_type:complete